MHYNGDESYLYVNKTWNNGIRTQNHLVRKRTLSYLASLANWLSVRLQSKLLWVRIPLLSLKLQIWDLFWARSSLTFRQTIECGFTLKLVRDMIITYNKTRICKFKVHDNILWWKFSLRSISNNFIKIEISKNSLISNAYGFSVDSLKIHEYLMNKSNIKQSLNLLNKVLLLSFSGSLPEKCIL